MNDTTLGLISAAVPLLIIGFVILRRLPWIFAFFVALLAVGLGYLETTGAVREFGHQVRVALPAGVLPEHRKAAETPAAADKQATEAPAASAPATPPAEPPAAPATTPPAETPAAPAPDATQPSSPAPAPASPAP